MNETPVTLVGNVVADPARRMTKNGDPYVTFRVASTVRRFDAATGGYVDGDTSFVDVRAFRRLAHHVGDSVRRGDPVVVTGRLRVREWTNGERSGTAVEIDARAVGHDLTWGNSVFHRVGRGGETRPVVGPDAAAGTGVWGDGGALAGAGVDDAGRREATGDDGTAWSRHERVETDAMAGEVLDPDHDEYAVAS